MNILFSILLGLVAVGGYFFPNVQNFVGATLPQTPALFETSLQSPITATADTMTLTSNSTRGGGSLSGYNCFTLDEGTAQWEVVCGTITSTSVTSMTRGIDALTGTSTDTDLRFAHRRGANVKITDYPSLGIIRNMMNGEETIPNLLEYTSGTDCTTASADTEICAKAYIDGVAVSGASDANLTTKGIVEIGTQSQTASSTTYGETGAYLAIPSNMATDTPNTLTNASRVLMSDLNGYLKQGWLNLTEAFTWTGAHIFQALVTMNGGLTSTATTTISASSVTGNALVLNGVPYSMPSSGIASSTTWAFDANGKATYWGLPIYTNGSFATTTTAGSTGTSTHAHGLGRIPKKIKITANYLRENEQNLQQSFGVYNGNTVSTVWSSLLFENGQQNNTLGISSTDVLYLFENRSTGQIGEKATITWDATNFYLTWSAITNFPTSLATNVMWEAE